MPFRSVACAMIRQTLLKARFCCSLRCKAKALVYRKATATATTRAKAKYRDLSTAAAKCAAFGRDDVCYGGGWRRRHSGRFAPLENAGILRCAQNDDVRLNNSNRSSNGNRSNNGNCSCNCKGKSNSWLGDGIRSHLRRIKPRRRWGTQTVFGWFRKGNGNGTSKDSGASKGNCDFEQR